MSLPAPRLIEAAHPSLAGHFPGDPIVPGVVLLEAVMAAVVELCGPCVLTSVPVVKFLHPLKPDQPFVVELMPRTPSPRQRSVRFRCTHAGVAVASGTLGVDLR